nr:MAG TPA: hypothetical protein [Caudoviricetes sp.]DAS19304.1 MAG TPA: hypothetical protein [Caudoviricetes sp.]DAW52311.1 MAG TPA: hypothetical protein [Caudoviricetes sp.]
MKYHKRECRGALIAVHIYEVLPLKNYLNS